MKRSASITRSLRKKEQRLRMKATSLSMKNANGKR